MVATLVARLRVGVGGTVLGIKSFVLLWAVALTHGESSLVVYEHGGEPGEAVIVVTLSNPEGSEATVSFDQIELLRGDDRVGHGHFSRALVWENSTTRSRMQVFDGTLQAGETVVVRVFYTFDEVDYQYSRSDELTYRYSWQTGEEVEWTMGEVFRPSLVGGF
ncbi:MAG: hypothetical protein KC561_09345 [Myxococcales bacterium]|nr:hypothetical protein [Myxococcales bacterium]